MAAPRVLILGAGYAGLNVARHLARRLGRSGDFQIHLVDQHDYHQFIVQLYEVAGGTLPPEAVTVPLADLLDGLPVTFTRGRVETVDPASRAVYVDGQRLTYDRLVFALGSETAYYGIPGLEEHALTLKSLADAQRIRQQVEQNVAEAARTDDAERRAMLLTVVVGGGGFTGTELAGELADFRRDLARAYGVRPGEIHVVLLEAADQVLRGFHPKVVDRAQALLARKGVRLRLGALLDGAERCAVRLQGGETIAAGTVIWTGGVRGSSILERSGFALGPGKAAQVNAYLQSVTAPDVYVVGDAASVIDPVTGRPAAPSAQLATREAPVAAANVAASLQGGPQRAFVPRSAGAIVSVGRRDAVALLGGVVIDGFAGQALKRLVNLRYISSIGGVGLALRRAPHALQVTGKRPLEAGR
ncbi:MAG TPA: NAD(P)/FAD-dependent oxidoreductase [Dehalococcoidia bacterium]